MFSWFKLAGVATFVIAVAGCATMQVSSHVQRDVDFSRYRTYDWGPADALPTGDPRLDNNPFFKDHMQGAVEKALAARGLALVSDPRADLLIHYHASVTQRLDVNRIDQRYGYCYGEDCNVRVTDYEAGTIVLDLVDGHTNRLVWRGWASDSLDGVIDNQQRMERMINQAVTRMMAQLPRAALTRPAGRAQ
jgi:hypothetical protein